MPKTANQQQPTPPREFTWRGVVGIAMMTTATIINLIDRGYRPGWFWALIVVGGTVAVFDAWRQAFRVRAWKKRRDDAASTGGRES